VQPEHGADVVPAPQLVPPARSACGLGRNWRRPPNCSEVSRQQRCEVRHGLQPRMKQRTIWGTTPRRAALRAEGSSADRRISVRRHTHRPRNQTISLFQSFPVGRCRRHWPSMGGSGLKAKFLVPVMPMPSSPGEILKFTSSFTPSWFRQSLGQAVTCGSQTSSLCIGHSWQPACPCEAFRAWMPSRTSHGACLRQIPYVER